MAFGRTVKIDKKASYRIKQGFELKEVVGRTVVVYMGDDSEFNGIIRLNEEGVFVWKQLVNGAGVDQIAAAMEQEYDADIKVLIEDVTEVLTSLLRENVIEAC